MPEPDSPDLAQLRKAVSAVKHGAVWEGFNGPTGVTKDEALEYAQVLADAVEGLLAEREATRIVFEQNEAYYAEIARLRALLPSTAGEATPDPPEVPVSMINGDMAYGWSCGWTAGYEAALRRPASGEPAAKPENYIVDETVGEHLQRAAGEPAPQPQETNP